MSYDLDVGYELQSTVLVADRDGSPICAPVQNLRTANALLSSRAQSLRQDAPHLEKLSEHITWL